MNKELFESDELDDLLDMDDYFEDVNEDEKPAPEKKNEEIPKDVEERTVHAVKSINHHKMRRIASELALEKELTWHFEKGVTYHCLSWGDIDSLTYLRAIVKQQHCRYVLISTWCMAMEDINEIESWIQNRYIDRIDFYVGEIFKGSYAEEYIALKRFERRYGGRVCIFRNHSKVMVAFGDMFDAVIESSANVNTNPRTEQTAITIDTELARWYKNQYDSIKSYERDFDNVEPFRLEEQAAMQK